jgi:hypothetical protein
MTDKPMPSERLAHLIVSGRTLADLGEAATELCHRIETAPLDETRELWERLLARIWPMYEEACEFVLAFDDPGVV